MVKRGLRLVAALALAGAGALGVADPASATEVGIEINPSAAFECHATSTVVPSDIYWAPYYVNGVRTVGWVQSGAVSGDGTCRSGTTTWQLTFTGGWNRHGGGGDCRLGDFRLDMHLASPSGSFDTSQSWVSEAADPTPGSLRWVIGVDPVYTPSVPFGTDSLSVGVPTSYGVAEANPALCEGWPAVDLPPPDTFPATPVFQVTTDWNFPGTFGNPSLLSLCLGVEGALPPACIKI
jgi:hypothetical protein